MRDKIIASASYICSETLEECINSIRISLAYESDLNSIVANEIILNDQIWKMPEENNINGDFYFVVKNQTCINENIYNDTLEKAKSLFNYKYRTNKYFAKRITENYRQSLIKDNDINMPKPIYVLYMNAEDPINPDNLLAYSTDPHILDQYALELKDADPDTFSGQYEIYKIEPIEKKFAVIN